MKIIKKWILQDANGFLILGRRVLMEQLSYKIKMQETLVWMLGPDFYAAQTFPMGKPSQ